MIRLTIIATHLLLTTLSSDPLNFPTNCNNHQLNYRVEVCLTKNNRSPRTNNSSTTIVITVLINPIVCSREIRIADCLSPIITKQRALSRIPRAGEPRSFEEACCDWMTCPELASDWSVASDVTASI